MHITHRTSHIALPTSHLLLRTSHIAHRTDCRRAAVLLVVLVILSIFAAVGLAFMFYASSSAISSQAFSESVSFRAPDIDPELAVSLFLQQFLFDGKDDASGQTSAMRGHSALRNMYGLNYTINANGTVTLVGPYVPFNGLGRIHHSFGGPFGSADDYNLPNYSYFPGLDAFVRDPERFGIRTPAAKGAENRKPYIGTANPPYTAVDMNCMFLAAMKADGTILMPSFHRDWTGFGSLDPSNPKWYTAPAADRLLKYMVMCPRPADHPTKKGKPGFSAPSDAGGHVRNRPADWPPAQVNGVSVENDSIWLYNGALIFGLPDGRRYTYLVAPLIIDLDGKLNVNAHGNIRGTGNTQSGGLGWGGPTEINLAAVLSASGGAELAKLFVGENVPSTTKQRIGGRYGPTRLPTGMLLNPFQSQHHFYSMVDFEGTNAGAATARWTAPGPFQCWPSFPPGFDTATTAADLNQHPLVYDPSKAAPGQTRVFDASALHKLYRHGDTGTDSLQSDLWQLLPVNMSDIRKRNLITSLSFDRRELGMLPWLHTIGAQNSPYQVSGYTPGGPFVGAKGNAIPTPAFSLYSNAASRNVGKEFGATDWRGAAPASLSPVNTPVDLNRSLVNYPTPHPTTGIVTDISGFQAAQVQRKVFAQDLFHMLIKATGAYDTFNFPNAPEATLPSAAQKDTLRYLAQIAVNIVDFIDTDDYITPFNWGRSGSTAYAGAAGGANDLVFGTELPKVVINEAYCEYNNDPYKSAPTVSGDPGLDPAQKAIGKDKATYYFVDVWAELCNPFKNDPTLADGGDAKLHTGTFPAYRLLVGDRSANMHAPANSDGRPDGQPPTGALDLTKFKGVVSDDFKFTGSGTDTSVIKALNGAFAAPDNKGKNIGFYVIGPKDAANNAVAFPAKDPLAPDAHAPKATLNAKGMRYKFTVDTAQPTLPPLPPSLLLQRLCCPGLPHNPDPNNAAYNPYITVDYFDISSINKGITQNGKEGPTGVETPIEVKDRKAEGRLQPYSAPAPVQAVSQGNNQPQHTFFYHNWQAASTTPWPTSGAAPTPPGNYPAFDWLVHLDRKLISPMELLHVSGYRPHELTQQFTGAMFGHQAPWFDGHHNAPNSRLYRFFEFVRTGPRQAGAGVRLAGKININTSLWGEDDEILQALCNPQAGNSFTAGDVATIRTALKFLRNPTTLPGQNDKPFLPLSAGIVAAGDPQYPAGLGIENTILRSAGSPGPNTPRLFEPPGLASAPKANPYMRYELLNKIYNNVTTRSNCFAVWGGASRTAETVNYEINRKLVVTQRPPGEIARMSLAVIVDDDHVVQKAGNGTQTVSRKARTPEELQQLQGIVAAAVGLEPGRGDQITVQNMSFDEAPAEEPAPMTTVQQITQYSNELWEGARIAAVLGLGLLAMLFFVRPLMQRLNAGAAGRQQALALAGTGQQLRTVADLESEIEAQLDASAQKADGRRLPVLARKVSSMSAKEPENVAKLLRSWINEGER